MDKERTLSRDQVREVDRRAIADFGIPGIVLMENASRAVADFARRRLSGLTNPRVTIVAGTGNNAGDGFAVARHLHNAELPVVVFLAGDPARISGDARTNLEIIQRMQLDIRTLSQDQQALDGLRAELAEADLVIDAIFGTGLSGPVHGFYAEVIETLNSSGSAILAVDIPSGLDCDTGLPLGPAVRAAATVSFLARKKGFSVPGADAYTGQVHIADIGAPRELFT
ncbi:MAG: NAD(P)H-hydrate epimerase [Actinobacteria bacterium]|nr:NAD(P)H-hydrate epimerase [Actinomycetota bacterium]